MLLEAFHLAAAALNTFTIYYDQYYADIPFPEKFVKNYPLRGRVVFFTIWCFIIQTIYFYVALINDFIGTNVAAPKKSPFIRKFKDALFALAFPTAALVSSGFLVFKVINIHLLLPEELLREIPVWYNHVMHTFIFVNIALEMLMSNINFPRRKLGLTILLGHKIIYIMWLFRIYYSTNTWVYPLFDFLNGFQIVAFFSFNIMVSFVFYLMVEKYKSSVSSSIKSKKKDN